MILQDLWRPFTPVLTIRYGRAQRVALRVGFDPRLKLGFHGAKVVRHARYARFQMAEVAVLQRLFREILDHIGRLSWLRTGGRQVTVRRVKTGLSNEKTTVEVRRRSNTVPGFAPD